MYGRPNIYAYMKSYFNGLASLGMKPLIILDTCAIIDLELATRKQINFGYKRGNEFVHKLNSLLSNSNLVIPDKIMREIENHKNCHISGTPEISEKTYDLLVASSKGIPEDVKSYVKDANKTYETNFGEGILKSSPSDLDSKLYLANWFLHSNKCNLSNKKFVLDIISTPDLDLIKIALTIANFSAHKFKLNEKNGLHKLLKETYKIAILSSDAHIYKTLNALSREPEFAHLKEYVNPINVRKYDLSCDTNE